MISEVIDQQHAAASDNGFEVRPSMTGENKRDWYPWVIVALLWMVCFFSYADRQAFFSVFPLLQENLHLTTVQLGLLGSSFAVVYGLAGPFAGLLADRIRRKTAIIAGLQFWSIICTVSAFSSTFLQLLVFRGLEGLGECIYSPAAMSMVSDYHDKRSRSKAMGILQTSVYAGTVGGGYWAASIAQRHGWRPAIFFFGIMGCLLGVALIKLMHEPIRGALETSRREVDAQGKVKQQSIRQAVSVLVSIKSFLMLMGGFACANFVAMVLLTWMPMYLYSRFHLSLSMAAFTAAMYPQLASVAGSVCGGYLADSAARRTAGGRMIVQCMGVMLGAPLVLLCGTANSLVEVKVALICWGFFKGVYDSNIFASAFDVVPASTRGTVSGCMNCVGWLVGGGLAPVLIGFLAGRFTLGTAIAFSSIVYVIAGFLLLTTVVHFLKRDIDRLGVGEQFGPVRA
jgi:sugar phosphate permease